LKNGAFWDVTLRGSCKSDVSKELSASFHQGDKNPLMKEAVKSSETLVLTRTTQCKIPEDAILRGQRRENLISYKT
jgi:hypothetical protein